MDPTDFSCFSLNQTKDLTSPSKFSPIKMTHSKSLKENEESLIRPYKRNFKQSSKCDFSN